MLLLISLDISFGKHMSPFFFNIYLRLELLGYWICVYLALVDIAKRLYNDYFLLPKAYESSCCSTACLYVALSVFYIFKHSGVFGIESFCGFIVHFFED